MKQNKVCFPVKIKSMPEISQFLGIIVTMSYQAHNSSHFHVRYDE